MINNVCEESVTPNDSRLLEWKCAFGGVEDVEDAALEKWKTRESGRTHDSHYGPKIGEHLPHHSPT